MAEILRWPRIDSVVWLLVVTLIRLSHEKEKAGQREIQNVQFCEKRSTRKSDIGAKLWTQGEKRKKMILDGIKGGVTSGQDPTNPPASEK